MTENGAQVPMDLVFFDTRDGEWALTRTNAAGEILHAVEGKFDAESAPRLESTIRAEVHRKASTADGKTFVVVAWQVERVLRDVACRPFGDRAVVDLYQMTWLLVAAGAVQDRRIETICAWSGTAAIGKTAAERVVAIRECYFRLVERTRVGMQVEAVGRELASKAAESVMKIVSRFTSGGTG